MFTWLPTSVQQVEGWSLLLTKITELTWTNRETTFKMLLTCHIALLTLSLQCYCVAGFLRGMLYPTESETRQVKSLDGMWDFRADVSSVGFEEMWYSLPLAQVHYSRSSSNYNLSLLITSIAKYSRIRPFLLNSQF